MSIPPIEPSSDVRRLAHGWSEMVIALEAAGFDRQEAFMLLRTFIVSTLGRPQ